MAKNGLTLERSQAINKFQFHNYSINKRAGQTAMTIGSHKGHFKIPAEKIKDITTQLC
jgi:hypothetical protein